MAPISRRRRPWTADNESFLKKSAGKTSAYAIAKRLNRTEGATRQKAFSMGLSLDTRNTAPSRRRRAA